LRLLENSLSDIESKFKANFVYYLAGADPFEDDSLGELKLTKSGLKKRDLMVKEFCMSHSIPCVITLAGGYARDFRETIEIHFGTVEAFSEKQ